MNDKKSVQLFDQNAGQLMAAQNDAAAVARATQEIQAALVIASRNPRDEITVKARVLAACERIELAEIAEYEYSRGGTRITGPTIDLLRMIANRWGNIRHGWTETERSIDPSGAGISTVRAFAWDMQTNTQAERSFKVKHWRDTQGGGYALKDERDIYEMIANAAARRVRACLEEVIDSDVVNDAVGKCRETLKNGGGKESLGDRAAKMVNAFKEFAVTQEMIELRLGNKLSAMSENQLASLKRVYKSLRDGVGTREEFFKPVSAAPDFETKPPGTATNQPPSATEAPMPATVSPPSETPPVKEPGDRSGYNPLKALRGLIKMGNFKESEMLEYWRVTGATDGSHATLEEVQISQPSVVEASAAQWPAIDAKLREARGAK